MSKGDSGFVCARFGLGLNIGCEGTLRPSLPCAKDDTHKSRSARSMEAISCLRLEKRFL